ncbi:MAG: type II toxin-antitoxin system PemK/MazF family toxin [Candidatus Nomurabacteria bacterium]|nr:type II toxin-antitoxin system PemK/MazF family toxin [Candidatus Nomurabacteria bacterium]
MQKDFDKWNTEKKAVDAKVVNTELFFHAREIWWCSAGLNVGVEADGKHENFERPMLIVKKFNADMVWALPLTTQGRKNKYYYKLNHEEVKSWVVLSQIKTISTKRFLRKVGSISESDFKEVILRLQKLLKIENPLTGAFSEAEATNTRSINGNQNKVKR